MNTKPRTLRLSSQRFTARAALRAREIIEPPDLRAAFFADLRVVFFADLRAVFFAVFFADLRAVLRVDLRADFFTVLRAVFLAARLAGFAAAFSSLLLRRMSIACAREYCWMSLKRPVLSRTA